MVTKGVTAILINRNDHRNDQPFISLRLRIESFAKVHDVETLLAQGRPHRRCRCGFAGGNLQFDQSSNFLGHAYTFAT